MSAEVSNFYNKPSVLGSSSMIKVLLVEDHQLVRVGLANMISQSTVLELVGDVDSGEEALVFLDNNPVDVVLMDIGLPGMTGIEATQVITAAYPSVKVLMLTSQNNEEEVVGAFKAGAHGYCLKTIGLNLKSLIEEINRGGVWLSPEIAPFALKALKASKNSSGNGPDGFSDSDVVLLEHLSNGLNNNKIAEKMSIQTHVVKLKLKEIFKKLSVTDRTHAATEAIRQGLIQ